MTLTVTSLILAALSGSLVTTIFGKIFDLFQKGKKHRMDLEKSFFAAKLKAAEGISEHSTSALTMMNQMRLVYVMIQEDLGKGPVHEVRRQLQEYLMKSAIEAMSLKESLKAAGAYNIYFGFATNSDFLQKAAPIHLLISELGPVLSAVLQFDFGAYEDQALARQKYGKVLEEAKAKVGELIQLMGNAADSISERLEFIYEYFAERSYLR